MRASLHPDHSLLGGAPASPEAGSSSGVSSLPLAGRGDAPGPFGREAGFSVGRDALAQGAREAARRAGRIATVVCVLGLVAALLMAVWPAMALVAAIAMGPVAVFATGRLQDFLIDLARAAEERRRDR